MTVSNLTRSGVVLRFGELFLKGKNRHVFEQALERNVKRAISDREGLKVSRKHGRIFVFGADDDDLLDRLSRVFGLASLSPVVFVDKDMEAFAKVALQLAEKRPAGVKTFRIAARRSDKKFPCRSVEIGRIIGSAVYNATGLDVDLERPDFTIGIEVGLEGTFMWSRQIKGAGGLPVGTSGRATLLLSGGIDSPVAGHIMQKRGLELNCVYFHAHPYTSEGAKDKVLQLAKLLAKQQKTLRLHIVSFTALQERMRDEGDSKYLVILYRRAMVRIAEALARQDRIRGLVTGECLGQVASQTLPNLAAIEDACSMPILRPLIGFDKIEVVDIAKQIGSYEISIIPHDDCCSLFVPRHPQTKASLPYVHELDERIEWEELLEEAITGAEIVDF